MFAGDIIDDSCFMLQVREDRPMVKPITFCSSWASLKLVSTAWGHWDT